MTCTETADKLAESGHGENLAVANSSHGDHNPVESCRRAGAEIVDVDAGAELLEVDAGAGAEMQKEHISLGIRGGIKKT